MKRPQPDEYGSFYKTYIDKAKDDVLAELEEQLLSFSSFLKSIPSDKENFAYAEGKWTVKEVLGHIIDTERIMAYRLMRVARNDDTPLPGFEENSYVQNAHFSSQDFTTMIDEFKAVRNDNLCLFKSLSEEELDRRGIASNLPVSVRSLLFIIAGHLNHHIAVIKERYL